MTDLVMPAAKKMKCAPDYSSVERKTSVDGNVSKWWIEVQGEKVLEKVVELNPTGVFADATHMTTVYALGEVVMSTTLHMKAMVHFEHKDKLEQAFAKITTALNIPAFTGASWDDMVRALQLNEMKNLHNNFYVNKAACPELCPNGPYN